MSRFHIMLSVLITITLSACSLLSGVTEIPEIPTPSTTVHLQTLQGTWRGTLWDSGTGITYTMTLVLDQEFGTSAIHGTLTFQAQDISQQVESQEEYEVSGVFDGINFRFNETEGRAFWGTMDGTSMNGLTGWCFECEAWGDFSLTLLEETITGSLPSIHFIDLSDGSILTSTIADNGFPVIDLVVETIGVFPPYTILALDVDGLWLDQAGIVAADPFTTSMQWTAWHGNGDYTLLVQALNYEAGGILASQKVRVTVSGIPAGTQTVRDRMIQLYQEVFGLSLTSPAFARYTNPDPGALEASRWVSSAYIGDKLYEINIFDNGFSGGMAYDLNSGENGTCRPAGQYSMLVIFVDYANTGLDPMDGIKPIETWQATANAFWADYSTSLGLTVPILKIDPVEIAIVSAPPHPGQSLTVEEVTEITGIDPSNFDWLVEIDLDANNSVAGQYGGLGISLNGACLPGGSQRTNIAFSAVDQQGLVNDGPGSVFGHELEHGMGWQHWWPNGLAGNADQVDKGQFWMPVLLFGWTDTDGDGIIEILDPATPYGLMP